MHRQPASPDHPATAATALETSGIPTPPLIWYNPTRNPQRAQLTEQEKTIMIEALIEEPLVEEPMAESAVRPEVAIRTSMGFSPIMRAALK